MVVLLISHITIALASISIAAFGLVRPSDKTLRQSYAAIGATLVSGTALVIASHSNILQSCMTGLAYVVGMTVMTAIAQYRLALERTK